MAHPGAADPGPADARATYASWSDAKADTKADSTCCTYPAANSSTSTNANSSTSTNTSRGPYAAAAESGTGIRRKLRDRCHCRQQRRTRGR